MVFRSVSLSALVLTIAACGVFSGSDSEPTPETPDGGAPPAPAPTPIGGTPIAGVFVSSSKGFADGDGAMSRPVKTLAAAIDLAKQKNLPVIACAETYAEAVKLIDGVTAYGFFDCSLAEWKRAEKHATIVAPTSPALLAVDLTLPARFEGFDLVSPDLPGTPDGKAETSFGMIVMRTTNLAFANVIVRAGKGQDGRDGVEPASNADTSANPHGVAAYRQGKGCVDLVVGYCDNKQFETGLGGGTSTCAVGPNGGAGGQGGDGIWYVGFTRKGAGAHFAGRPDAPGTSTTAQGGPPVRSAATWKGTDGAVGGGGAAGKNEKWQITASGFVPGAGTQGSNGYPGIGGGGGGGADYWQGTVGVSSPTDGDPYHYGGIGGGGGAGGCAGLAGTPGGGGGASIALFVVDSEISFESSRIEAGRGGRAGKGALGSAGNNGGNGGPAGSPDYEFGGAGGKGGKGGDGGPSGHGSAGPSITIAYHGKKPDLRAAVAVVAGTPGDGQPELARGDKVVPAVTGEVMTEHSF
jgi:hypothetical protein